VSGVPRLLLVALALTSLLTAGAAAQTGRIGPAQKLLNNGRKLDPAGRMSGPLGNLPSGGALTANGRFLWTVSAGRGRNDIRIVEIEPSKRCRSGRKGRACRRAKLRRVGRVVQTIPMPGASGGIAMSPDNRTAYVSGTPDSANKETTLGDAVPGKSGDVIHVFRYDGRTGKAERTGTIPVPPPSGSPAVQGLYDITSNRRISWPQDLAISRDGHTLLAALNLADHAAIIDTGSKEVRYVKVGRFPYGAGISRDGKTGVISNEAAGTVSFVDLAGARVTKTVGVGEHLSHPQGIAMDPRRPRAYVAVNQQDQVTVLDLEKQAVEKTISLGRPEGRGVQPVALSVTPKGERLLVADAGENAIAVIDLDKDEVTGRVPTADYPVGAWEVPKKRHWVWLSGKGLGTGANPDGPDPIKENLPQNKGKYDPQYTPHLVIGRTGVITIPTAKRLRAYSARVEKAIRPTNAQAAPADTVIRPGGPIQHVFYIVKENRTYDQVLGDDPRGDGDPRLTLFGRQNTPNVHALAERFPLLDHVYANSEASIDGHFWTSAGTVSNYVVKAWHANYGDRKRPYDFGVYAVTWPSTRFIFDAAEKAGVSYFNYGEALAGTAPLPDVDRTQAENDEVTRKLVNADLGQNGCYPNDASSGGTDEIYKLATGDRVPVEVYDSSLPAGAAVGAMSRYDCFERRFTQQLATGTVPQFNYMILANNHTAGTTPGKRTPQSMVADNDYAVGQVVELISHSSVWASSLILVIEDDSQNGADHVDAHRIPALAISPYARRGAVVSDRYDMLSFLATLEIVLGMKPMNVNDALATPLYNAFATKPDNGEPFDALLPPIDRTAKNPENAPLAELSREYVKGTDEAPQIILDRILWAAVHGEGSKPPPPGPNADPEAVEDEEEEEEGG
jgi:DNA-binding beta-propeller fold protein YncE